MIIEVVSLTIIFPAVRWCRESRLTTEFMPMGSNLYRMEEGFLCGPVSFGDVIEAFPTDQSGVLRFSRRVERAGLRRNCYVIPHSLVENVHFAELAKRITDLGGFAAVDFKGLFLVYLPKTCDLDVSQELDRIAEISKWKRRLLSLRSEMKRRWQKHIR